MNERNQAFDALKGFLIILVIMGHVLLGSISENLGREIIYFFHMPIFLAVTGFFTKKSLITSDRSKILLKYKNRMIYPFLLAFMFYTTLIFINGYINDSLGLKEFVGSFLYPYYHLWYIPAIIIFTFYTKVIEKFSGKVFMFLLSVFLLLTVFFEGFGKDVTDNIVYMIFGDKRFYYFFTYYFIGYYYASRKPSLNNDYLVISLIVGTILYGFSESEILIGLGKTVANISIILLTLSFCVNSDYKSSFLAKIGRVSLPIYLWHVAPLLILKKLPITENIYYLSSMIIFT